MTQVWRGWLVLVGLCLALGTPAQAQHALINGNRTLAGWLNACTTTGTPNAYACTLPKLTEYRPQMCVSATMHAANTGSITLNVNGLGAKPVQKWAGGTLRNLDAGDVGAGQILAACYDQTRWQVQSLGGGATGGAPPGLTWNVTPSACTGDPNGGKLTVIGTEIQCASDIGGAGGSTAFGTLATGVNTTATMQVGTGASLAPVNTGIITANRVSAGGVGIVKVDAQGVASLATYQTVVSLWTTCTGTLLSNGTCDNASYTPTARTLTLQGTANQVTVTPGTAQTLGADRTWTVAVPANAQLSIAKLTNLTSNGVVTTSGGDGTLSVTPGTMVTASGTLTLNAPVLGAGGAAVSVGTRAGDTTSFATTTGAWTLGDCVSIGTNGNLVAAGGPCTTGGGGGTVNVGTAGNLAYYATSTNAVSDASIAASNVALKSGTLAQFASTTLAALNTLISDADLVPTTRTLTAGFGMQALGDLSANRTVAMVQPSAGDQVYVSDSTSAATWRTLTDCQGTGKAVTYTSATNTFGCNTITSGASAFDALGSGTNTTAAMVVGSGASLTVTGTGITQANRVVAGGAGIVKVDAGGVPSLATAADLAALTAVTAAAPFVSGNLIQAAGANRTTSDSGLALTSVVRKVLTPLAQQVGVWTSDVLLAGDPGFTFNTSTKVLTLGTPGQAVGTLRFANTTAQTVSLVPTTGTLGNTTITVPGLTGGLGVTGTLVEGRCVEVSGGRLVTGAQACNTFGAAYVPPRTTTLDLTTPAEARLVGPTVADYFDAADMPTGRTVQCPSGAAADNDPITFRLTSLTPGGVTIAWDGCYTAAAGMALPSTLQGDGKTDYFRFLRNTAANTWVFVARPSAGAEGGVTTFTIQEGDGTPGASQVNSLILPNGSIASLAGQTATLDFPTWTNTGTVSAKRILPRAHSQASTATLTPNFDLYDQESVTAQGVPLTIQTPLYTEAHDGELRQITIKDDGTARALTWTTGLNAFATEGDLTLPTTTVIGKTYTYQFRWNAATTVWSLVGKTQGVEPLSNMASQASILLGRGDSGAGPWQDISLGSGLTMTGTTLSATQPTITSPSLLGRLSGGSGVAAELSPADARAVLNQARTATTTSTAAYSPDCGLYDQFALTAQAVDLTVNAPINCTLEDGRFLTFVITNSAGGQTHALLWNGIFAAENTLALPTQSVADATVVYMFRYNAATSKLALVGATYPTGTLAPFQFRVPAGTDTATHYSTGCTQGDLFFDTNATAGQNVYGCTTTGTGGSEVWTLQGGSGGGGVVPLQPVSRVPDATGFAYGCVIDAELMDCFPDATTLTSDAKWQYTFQLPPVLTTGCTLQVDVKTLGDPGTTTISLRPEWKPWPVGVSRASLAPLTSETVTPTTRAGQAGGTGDTLQVTTADANQVLRVTWTLDAATEAQDQRLALDLVVVNATHTTGVPIGVQPSLLCQ